VEERTLTNHRRLPSLTCQRGCREVGLVGHASASLGKPMALATSSPAAAPQIGPGGARSSTQWSFGPNVFAIDGMGLGRLERPAAFQAASFLASRNQSAKRAHPLRHKALTSWLHSQVLQRISHNGDPSTQAIAEPTKIE